MRIENTECDERMLEGQRIAVVGRLAGMSRRDVEQFVGDRGGQIASRIDAETNLVVLNDDAGDIAKLAADTDLLDEAARMAWREGRLEFVRESEFWARLGLVDAEQDVRRLYTPAMLAELVRVPVQAIRHWHRKGRLIAARSVGRLPYFDFEEVRVARRLAELLSAGCSLCVVDRKLDEFSRSQPHLPRPLADANVIVVGSRLYVRRGDNVTEPTGQLLIDFNGADTTPAEERSSSRDTIPFAATSNQATLTAASSVSDGPSDMDELRALALDFDECGEPERAIEVYRAILMSGTNTAEDHFSLAELLYRTGELGAARERYYAAIELDEDYVEARSNLGCVLVEQGELPLAEAAFRGALRYHAGFADAHFHLARLLDAMNRAGDASRHWHRFLALAPASPWAEEARDRIRGLSASGIARPSAVDEA